MVSADKVSETEPEVLFFGKNHRNNHQEEVMKGFGCPVKKDPSIARLLLGIEPSIPL